MKEFPLVDNPGTISASVDKLLKEKKFVYRNRDGEMLYQKGKGVWVAPQFIKLTFTAQTVRVEAWIDAFGDEQGLEGLVGSAAKAPLKKLVAQVEQILQKVNPDYQPDLESAEEMDAAPMEEEPEIIVPATKKEYLKKYAGESFYTNLRVTAIVGYVLCGILALSALANPFALLDVVIFLALVLGMHLGKSMGCAIAITAYSACSMVLLLIATGTLSGWGWLIVGIYGIIIFQKADKRYRKLKNGEK